MLPKGYLWGNIVADPQCGVTGSSQKNYARFAVACDDRFARLNETPKTHFFNLVAWQKNAHFIQEFIRKGDRVFIEFSAQTTSYVNQEGKTIKSIDFVVLSIDKIGGSRSAPLKPLDGPNSSKPSSDGESSPLDDEETSDISLDDIF